MTKDRGEDYGLVKGFLLAKDAPQEVLQALAKLKPPHAELIELGPRPPLITPEEPEEADALLRPEQDTLPPPCDI